MNLDLLSYIVPIAVSSLSLLSAIYSLFYAQKISRDISQAISPVKINKQKKNNATLNQKNAGQELRDKLDSLSKLNLQKKEIGQLQTELEEMNKLLLRYEELAKQESDAKKSETYNQQITLLKQIADLLEKSAIPKIEALGISEEL